MKPDSPLEFTTLLTTQFYVVKVFFFYFNQGKLVVLKNGIVY